jgi:hypothetical protein
MAGEASGVDQHRGEPLNPPEHADVVHLDTTFGQELLDVASRVDREYAWTDAGKASAAHYGVTEREAIEALYSPQRIENEVGTPAAGCGGLAESTRVIVVLCERIAKVNSFAILAVRPATPEEIKLSLEGTR